MMFAAAVDCIRLPLAAVHGLHLGDSSASGNVAEDRHNVADAFVFNSGVPSSRPVTPGLSLLPPPRAPADIEVSTEIWT